MSGAWDAVGTQQDAYGVRRSSGYAYNANGDVTRLSGASGVLPIGAPAGMSGWMPDTVPQYDVYAQGLVLRPTIYFDPSSTATYARGTYAYPYTTATQLDRVIAGIVSRDGNAAGQVIGFKRGTRLLGGLSLSSVCGSSTNVISFVPYGDAEALPIISGGSIYSLTGNAATGWASVGSGVYKLTLASEADVFNQGFGGSGNYIQRYWKVSNSGIASEAAAITALRAASTEGGTYPGSSMYYSGALYIYPFNDAPDWNQVEVGSATNALGITYANVSASGYITVAGLHIRCARDSALSISGTGGSITTLNNVTVAGCKSGQAGYDNASSVLGSDGIVIYGKSDSVRLAGVNIVGCNPYDALNNGIEVAAISSGFVQQNTNYRCPGKQIELWYSVSNLHVRDNYAEGRYNSAGNLHTPLYPGNNIGIWCPAWSTSAGTASDATKNTGNLYYRNVMVNLLNSPLWVNGALAKAYNNTFTNDYSTGAPGVNMEAVTTGTANLDLRNNIILGLNTTAANSIFAGVGPTITGSVTNLMRRPNGGFRADIGATPYTTIGAWNTAFSDTSVTTDPVLSSTFVPTVAGVLTGGTAVAGYTERDRNGATYSTSPAIGAYHV